MTDDYEIVVVNDGSQDYTRDVLEELKSRYPELRVIHYDRNRGYGAALRTGFAAATKEWVFYTDGDAQYNPMELVRLVEALLQAAAHPDTDGCIIWGATNPSPWRNWPSCWWT